MTRLIQSLSFIHFRNIVRMRKGLVFCVLIPFMIAACQSSGGIREHAMKTSFNPGKANYVFTQGTGQISGQAFINAGGKIRYASGGRVSLVPATAYANERMKVIYGSGNTATKPVRFTGQDPQYRNFARHHTASKNGEFIFRNVAPGDYYITTGIVWREEGGSGKYNRVALKKRVSISEGQKINITLSSAP